MLANLVEGVREKTLVFIDEPESHLHPPLLSAFIRALSELMRDTIGLCIVATHSPVVLQEVPKSCVWLMDRRGEKFKFNRPERETFGENVGVLTTDVFGLEVTDSGFHTILKRASVDNSSYNEALSSFNGNLGGEAKAILRALFSSKT